VDHAAGLLKDEIVHQPPSSIDGLGPDARRSGQEIIGLDGRDVPATGPSEERRLPIPHQLSSRNPEMSAHQPMEPR
jgi:hypothetical protein